MKKGFIFMETLIVLVVLLTTLVGMYGMFIKVSSDIENRKYFDNISDLYKTDIIRSNIDSTKIGIQAPLIEITPSNCASYMNSTCGSLMNSLNAENIYINTENISSILISQNINIKNSMREYLKTINTNKGERYIIVNYKQNDKNYYASLRI